ncbi:MAG: hypothetical protein ACM3PY_02635, partial [Omnitrophica WOR_2 bacterium]
MRITSETLLKIARDTISQRSKTDRDLLAAYLHGSMLSGDAILGGTADIDLFFIHNGVVLQEREIIRLTEDVHLDITHHARAAYRHTKELRQDPWLGSTIYGAKILYDPQHFMDFTQASVRGQYNLPENIMAKSNGQAAQARQLWLSFVAETGWDENERITQYLQAVELAANSIACLSGSPLTERRFLLEFPKRAEAIGHPGLSHGLLGLLGGSLVDADTLKSWLPLWCSAYESIPVDQTPITLHAYRLPYYRKAFEAILGSEHPQAVLWPMLRTWSQADGLLAEDASQHAGYQAALE